MSISNSALPASPLPTSEARSAFEAVEHELRALDPADIQAPRVEVQRSAAVAHSIAIRDGSLPRLARFEQLVAAGLYPADRARRLARLALATWFARQQQLGHRALASGASVPEEILRQAHLLRGRMLRVLEYWLEDDPRLMDEVAAIRRGAGYVDLANDLEQLADIHQRPFVRAQIGHDPKHVDPRDVEQARALAQEIFSCLGLGEPNAHQRWSDLCQRAWALLLREYEEHRAAGVFLMRHHEDVEQTYPSLIAVARSSRTRTTGEPELDAELEPVDAEDDAIDDVEAAAE